MNASKLVIVLAVGLSLTACRFDGKSDGKTDSKTEQAARTAVANDKFDDIEIPDIDRNYVSVVEHINKKAITIIDFWASWCGPCRKEMPVMTGIYEKYKDKGLGIIGISLDSNYDAWHEAIDNYHMEWLQLSDLRGWESTAAQKNNVTSIPYTIVVDNEARILAKGLRGENLTEFIDNWFDNKTAKR